ncbi:hypothetical protein [Nitrosococcus watsonii]|uniref:Hydrazine synthase alpha subunit middle domain-containing protein n=1 Tax=Nitrosococcus watsoni (strain C-113) TaxID=105559 RepID=D8K5M2_NITWC|nr:hypothetical protein [Nitrosococcus watsonii]ADJ28199.1 conserved hypothetical protein [Nitrosococcus watsonii C-113]
MRKVLIALTTAAIFALPVMAEVTFMELKDLSPLESRIIANEGSLDSIDQDLSDHEDHISTLETDNHSRQTVTIDGFVYARVKRTETPITIKGETWYSTSTADRLIDVTRQGTDSSRGSRITAPGELVWLKGSGEEVILHHCEDSKIGEPTCLVVDPRVSYDGKHVAYTLIEGTMRQHQDSPVNKVISPQQASLHFVDLTDLSHTAWPAVKGVFDMQPQWLPDGDILFVSNRDHIKAGAIDGFSPDGEVSQLWRAHIDGSGAHNISPDILGDALHPIIHPTGKVLFSSWKRDLETTQNSTLDNKWYIAETRQDGSEHNAIWGAHARFLPNPDNITLTALHFFGVRSNGDMCTTMYYRQNTLGSGNVQCFKYPTPNHPEGKFPFKAKEGRYLGLWGMSGDHQSIPGGIGKTRDPMGLPDGGLVFAADRQGVCGFYHSYRRVPKDNIGCDFGIYTQSTIPEQDADSRVLIVNSPHWHEIQPQPVMPYQAIYGIEKPPVLKMAESTQDGKCILRSASNRMQVDNEWGYFGPDNSNPCQKQGCSMTGVDKPSLMTSIKFWRPIMFDKRVLHRDFDAFSTHRLEVLGTVPMQPDGSFTAEVPCDTPFFMAGADSEGRSLARDKMAMSLRPGEIRTCSGCHNHDDDDPPRFEDSDAANATPTPVSASGTLLEWTADIWPIIQQCDANYPEINLAAMTEKQAFDRFTKDSRGRAKAPWRSKWINWLFARESLMYWRAAGWRTDGRGDATRSDDIDYGTSAPIWQCLTDKQLQILADWIESGAYRKNAKW